jgi:hypothetical protein
MEKKDLGLKLVRESKPQQKGFSGNRSKIDRE